MFTVFPPLANCITSILEILLPKAEASNEAEFDVNNSVSFPLPPKILSAAVKFVGVYSKISAPAPPMIVTPTALASKATSLPVSES